MKTDHDSISQFCFELGQDSLLIQGAGGNISWKDGDNIWIKGSGAWMANAKSRNIFVCVDLKKLTSSLSEGDFSATPELIMKSDLRPSIETILHALMPQKVVIHLHAVTPLAILVLQEASIKTAEIVKRLSWGSAFIDYFKPGAELAQAIDGAMKKQDGLHILFLKNHGIVIGGESIPEVRSALKDVLTACLALISPKPEKVSLGMPDVPVSAELSYRAFDDLDVQGLAKNPSLFHRLNFDWALYPDHVVFLGPKAFTYTSWKDFFSKHNCDKSPPELIFIENEGVFVAPNFNYAKAAQLRCYYDVISRIFDAQKLDPLKESDISTLLNWDAEKLRQKIST